MDGLSIVIGIGLSAACGFRVFVPLLIMSLAALNGHLSLAPAFEWIGSPEACTVFAVATVCEVLAYYIPWLDNLLDSLSSPAAVVAGTITTASVLTDVSPFLQWSLAVIAGGGAAGIVQAGTVLVRGASSISTAGLANPVVATVEVAAATTTSILSLIAPIVAVATVTVLVIFAIRRWNQRRPVIIGENRQIPM
ncbi:MAG: DUF4126 domain-containing protein [Desulfobulbaceae bacterium]|nr:DUF4126 domain-containing protein [Desulfobulbaceae bacterium]